jgi:hypothetical protein
MLRERGEEMQRFRKGFRIDAPLEVPHDAPQRLDCSCCSARALRDYAVHATPADAASLS